MATTLGGCAQGETFPDDDCAPNDRKACSCDDGGKGWQLCLKSRSYEPCACTSGDLNEAPPGPPACGNGRLEPGETCDDRNDLNNDGCSALCQRGNGVEGRDGCEGLRPLPLAAGESLEGRQALGGAEGRTQGSCGGEGAGAELVFAFTPKATGALELVVTPADSGLDVVLYVRGGACGDEGAEPAGGCRDEGGEGGEERLSLAVEAGTSYFVFADARAGGGEVTLAARLDEGARCGGEGAECETGLGGDCAAGRLTCFENKYLVCRPVDEDCG